MAKTLLCMVTDNEDNNIHSTAYAITFGLISMVCQQTTIGQQ
jgi:hypothetical protein